MNGSHPNPLKPGDVVARRFVVLRHLRDEPCGNVWLAQDRTLGEDVTLKFLPRTTPRFEEFREALRQEAALALKLSHPGILKVFHYNEGDEGVYLLQEPFQGESLLAHLNRLERFPLPAALDLLEQVACALAAAHQHNIVHQSFNPLNILIEEHQARLINFSCPAPEEPDPQVTHLELRAYVAPETLRGERVTPAANVFSLGVLGFRLAAGSLPYPLTFDEPLPYRLEEVPVDLGEIPLPLQNLLLQCLAPDPRDRFEDAGAFLAALGQRRESWRTPSPLRWAGWGRDEREETGGLGAAAARFWKRLREETGQTTNRLREGLQQLRQPEAAPWRRRLLLGLAGLALIVVALVWAGRALIQQPEPLPPATVGDLKLPPLGGPPLSAALESAPAPAQIPNAAAPAAPAPAAKEAYQVLVLTTARLEDAKALKKRLEAKNIPARITRSPSGQKTFFLVKAGPFPERQQAEELARRLKAQERLPSAPKVVKVTRAGDKNPHPSGRP